MWSIKADGFKPYWLFHSWHCYAVWVTEQFTNNGWTNPEQDDELVNWWNKEVGCIGSIDHDNDIE
mgnify:CR=1 FL=1